MFTPLQLLFSWLWHFCQVLFSTHSIIMLDMSITVLRQNTYLWRRLCVIKEWKNLQIPLSFQCSHGVGGGYPSLPLWLKWEIECVCTTHREAHYNAVACCWKWPWPGAVIQNVSNEGPPSLFMGLRSHSKVEERKRSWIKERQGEKGSSTNISIFTVIEKL